MTDPTTNEPYSPAQAAGIVLVTAAVTIISGVVLWMRDGWSSWIAGPLFWLGALCLLGSILGLYDTLHPNDPERRRVFALGFLGTFFALAGSGIAWVMFRPGSTCSDCDSALGLTVGIGIMALTWGMTAVSIRQITKGRPS